MKRALAAALLLALAASASAQTITRPPPQVTPPVAPVTPPPAQTMQLSEVQQLRNENAALRRDLDATLRAMRTYARCQREILSLQGTGVMSASSGCPGTQDANLSALYNALPAR